MITFDYQAHTFFLFTMKKLHSLTIIFFLCFALQAADVVTLKNQQKFEGKITKISTNSLEFKAARNCYEIPLTEIEAIAFSNANNPILIALLDDSLTVDNCMKGRKDAKKLIYKLPGFVFLGMFGGPFPLIFIKFSKPLPQKEPMITSRSENKVLFDDPAYLNCYQKQVKKQNMLAVGVGWTISTAFLVNLLFNQ
ncbi:MAG: hypothetical protein K9J18_04105 [Crocinitomicaceae bacterium]|nr:hypothetical protein [Crocinitomicaceae bacterium]